MDIRDVLYNLVDDEGFIKSPAFISKQIEYYADEFAKKFYQHVTGLYASEEVLTEFKNTLKP